MQHKVYVMKSNISQVYKIGITKNNGHTRSQQINNRSNMTVYPIYEKSVKNADKLEKTLHEKYKSKQYTKAIGDGKTEFFKLSSLDLQIVIWTIRLSHYKQIATKISVCLIFVAIGYLIGKYL
jgi:hypothetical protein